MKKFNIRKVLDGLKEVSSSAPSVQVGPQENNLVHETLQSEHFQLCKTVRHGFPYQPSSMAFDPVQKILAVGTQSGALRLDSLYSVSLSSAPGAELREGKALGFSAPFMQRIVDKIHNVVGFGIPARTETS
ncbi:unnamed protein product [Arctogadus glacialis]